MDHCDVGLPTSNRLPYRPRRPRHDTRFDRLQSVDRSVNPLIIPSLLNSRASAKVGKGRVLATVVEEESHSCRTGIKHAVFFGRIK